MYYVIDRFEQEIAVLVGDDRVIIRVPVSALPTGARENDVLTCSDGVYAVDSSETSSRTESNKRRLSKLFKD